METAPQVRFARSGDVSIAYQVLGEGDLDLVLVPGWVSNLDALWREPGCVRLLSGLASFARVIVFDKRGTGLSDRVSESDLPTLEQRMDDVRAVMDAAGSERAALLGVSEGGPMSALFSATYPERTEALIMYGSYARWMQEPDYPWAPTREQHALVAEAFERDWGTPLGANLFAPSLAEDEAFLESWAAYLRAGASPSAAIALLRMNIEIDVRPVLPTIRVPTLVLHRRDDRLIRVECGRYLAEHIPDARMVELPGADHLFFVGDVDSVVDEVQEFLTGARREPEIDRVLATVLFTDIVKSSERAVELGDRRWRELLERYYGVVRGQLQRYRGREMDTAGDGFFATFDGPARAIRCAWAIHDALGDLQLAVRAGIHTGECEVMSGKVGGIAVHTAARVLAQAEPGEVLASQTVRDLVAGSGLEFHDRGVHALKGIPGQWQLFAAEVPAPA
ncbi:MAG: adenylate/guanylate cyclase domain-containing protein [Deltaproteobacteria bacterium]|nr:adenylate/guanylate cyclase domain-containing protein [Deltaproteobacteria bacterium]MBW2417505.1 adenylate/guanylate cyclase domain-containing protein [Deltaproteobacteria bacterium]